MTAQDLHGSTNMDQDARNEALPLGPVRSQSLAEQTCDAIVDGIAAGVLKPGQRLVETQLSRLFHVSRVPLREALKVLEAQGIVESSRHRGSHVAQFDETRFDQICEARVALERIAVARAALACRRSPELVERFRAIVDRMEAGARQLDWTAISKADLAFHRQICFAADNAIVLTLWEAIARHVLIVFGHEIRHERDAAAVGPDHRRLLDLMLTGDQAQLDDAIERHIMRLRERRRQAKVTTPSRDSGSPSKSPRARRRRGTSD